MRLLITGQPTFMHNSGFEVHLASAEGDDWNYIDDLENFHIHHIDFARQISLKKDWVALFKLIRLFRKSRPQIVHTHTPKAGLLGMLAAKICGVPVRIHTLAGMPLMTASGIKRSILSFTEKLTFSCSTETWPNSKRLLQYILQHKMIAPEKAHIILSGSSNGISLEKFSKNTIPNEAVKRVSEDCHLKNTDFVFLAVGRMVNDKGIAELVESFIEIHAERTNAKLILLGPFEAADALSDGVVSKIKSHPAIIHVEWSNEVECFMAASNCFVHASHREGFPNVVLQAGAMGLPVVCSDIPGNIDIIESDSEGFVYPVKNKEQLKSAMLFVMENNAVAAGKAAVLQQKIINCFDRRAVQQAIKERYIHLLTQKNIDVSSIH